MLSVQILMLGIVQETGGRNVGMGLAASDTEGGIEGAVTQKGMVCSQGVSGTSYGWI